MSRLVAIVIKEAWALLRDPRSRMVLIVPPLMQLLIFTYALTMEVRNVDIAVVNQSNGAHAAELIARIDGSPNFRHVLRLTSRAEAHALIDRQTVIVALFIPPDFDARVNRGEQATVGAILDGRRSNAAQIVGSYLGQIAGAMGAELEPGARMPAQGSVVTHWFNPSLEFVWFNVPALTVIIVATTVLAQTAQSVAREREMGTFDQLMVSPLRVHEILIGKMAPPLIIGLIEVVVYYLAARLVYGVPFVGSFALFLFAQLIFMLSMVGIGMFISSASATQQQAFLGSFIVVIPITLLSGFASPVENMPDWLQALTYLNPARYALELTLGLYLKDMPLVFAAERLWPLLLIGVVTLAAAAWLFRARME